MSVRVPVKFKERAERQHSTPHNFTEGEQSEACSKIEFINGYNYL
jgi:hypothetical protein